MFNVLDALRARCAGVVDSFGQVRQRVLSLQTSTSSTQHTLARFMRITGIVASFGTVPYVGTALGSWKRVVDIQIYVDFRGGFR